jgi:hypothetical protein
VERRRGSRREKWKGQEEKRGDDREGERIIATEEISGKKDSE